MKTLSSLACLLAAVMFVGCDRRISHLETQVQDLTEQIKITQEDLAKARNQITQVARSSSESQQERIERETKFSQEADKTNQHIHSLAEMIGQNQARLNAIEKSMIQDQTLLRAAVSQIEDHDRILILEAKRPAIAPEEISALKKANERNQFRIESIERKLGTRDMSGIVYP